MPTWDPRDNLAADVVRNIVHATHDGHLCRHNETTHWRKWQANCPCACDQYSSHECQVCSICGRFKCEIE